MKNSLYFYKSYGMYLFILILAMLVTQNIITAFCLMFMLAIFFVYMHRAEELDKDLRPSMIELDRMNYKKNRKRVQL